MYLAPSPLEFNAEQWPTEPPRREFLRLGAELSNRGQRPVAEFVSELADLPPDVVVEVRARLEAYVRIPASVYRALGGNTFSPYLVGLPGGRRD